MFPQPVALGPHPLVLVALGPCPLHPVVLVPLLHSPGCGWVVVAGSVRVLRVPRADGPAARGRAKPCRGRSPLRAHHCGADTGARVPPEHRVGAGTGRDEGSRGRRLSSGLSLIHI